MREFPNRRIWIAPLGVALLVALFGWWCNTRLRETIETQLRAELTTTLDANVTALEIWITNQFKLATAIAGDPQIHDLALRTLERAGGQSPTDSPPPVDDVRPPADRGRPPDLADADTLEARLRPRLEQIGYGIAHLVHTNLTVVGGSMRGRIRARMTVDENHVAKFNELFASGRPVVITPFKPQPPRRPGLGGPQPEGSRRGGFGFRNPPGGPPPFPEGRTNTGTRGDRFLPPDIARFRRGDLTLMQVAVPVRDDQGAVLGALALILDPDREFTRILSVARRGKSGETYAFDQRGLMISRSRFDDQLKSLGLIEDRPGTSSALNLRLSDPEVDLPAKIVPEDPSAPTRPLIRSVARAVAGEAGVDLTPARDYRGVPVISAWRWLPDHAFGVATQVNATEAYQPLRVLNLLFLILFLLLLLCATGMLLFSYASVVWRRRLGEAELRLRQLGQYTLEEKIGEGGMGVVYRARHALLRRDTAVKLLLPDRANPAAIARFEREVCLTCQLTHPNTIQVYDYGRTPDGIFYYAMEYLQGLNLHDLIRCFGPQPEGRVVYILVQVCEALAEAHARGLVHRDIKPANVFLCRRGGLPDCVKVLDFGLVRDSRAVEDRGTRDARASTLEGTPSYMPPEAIHGTAPSDPRSDIYSLGALGYFLVTGHPVFETDDVTVLYEKHLREVPAPPSRRTSNPISREFEETLLRCLAKQPDARPQSVTELRSALLLGPHALDWGPEARAAWWDHRQDSGQAAAPAGTDSATRTSLADVPLQVDFAARQP